MKMTQFDIWGKEKSDEGRFMLTSIFCVNFIEACRIAINRYPQFTQKRVSAACVPGFPSRFRRWEVATA